MKKTLIIVILIILSSQSFAQNQLKAKIEFESAEQLYSESKFDDALSKLIKTEELLGKWQPNISYLKILSLKEVADLSEYTDKKTLLLANEVKNYMDFANKNQDNIVLDKFNVVYNIEKDISEIIEYAQYLEKPEYLSGKKAYDNKKYDEAMNWYLKAAEKKNLVAMDAISDMYRDAIGVAQNYEKSMFWDKKAADLGYTVSMNDIGDYYFRGLGVTKNCEEAIRWYRKAADKGNLQAMNFLGWINVNGFCGINVNYPEAQNWFKKVAEKGSAYSMEQLGYAFFYDEKSAVRYSEAFKWFTKAAQRGLRPSPNYYLAYLYENGLGVEKNPILSYNNYLIASENGSDNAMIGIGNCYFNGFGVSKNLTEAFNWYKKAAEKENVEGQVQIGYMYLNGFGTKKDYQEAMNWCLKAAEKGNINAMANISYMYENGLGVKKDKKIAKEWKLKSSQVKN